MSLNSTPRTWVSAEVVTAAEMNAEVRDAFNGVEAAWTAYTPTWTGTTNPAIVNGTLLGAYRQIGHTVEFWIEITMGSSTTYGTGAWSVGLPPVTESAHRWTYADGCCRDTSATATFPLYGERASAGVLALKTSPATAGNALITVNPTAPFTWAVGDVLVISGRYETA